MRMLTHSLESVKQDILKALTTTVQEMLESFTKKITKAMDTMIHDMKCQLVTLRQLYEDKLKVLEQSLESLAATCERNAEKYNRISRRNELVVEGIPYKAGENLANYFSSMCLSLGYTNKQLPIADMRRTRSSSAGTKTPIVIEFALCSQRDAFFRRYLHTRKLSLMQLGFDTGSRIYVNENLTPLARRLLADALDLKRNGKLRSAYTRNGVIHVESNDGRFIINSHDDLHAATQSSI